MSIQSFPRTPASQQLPDEVLENSTINIQDKKLTDGLSHGTTIKEHLPVCSRIRDLCNRQGIECPTECAVTVFSDSKVSNHSKMGWAIDLTFETSRYLSGCYYEIERSRMRAQDYPCPYSHQIAVTEVLTFKGYNEDHSFKRTICENRN